MTIAPAYFKFYAVNSATDIKYLLFAVGSAEKNKVERFSEADLVRHVFIFDSEAQMLLILTIFAKICCILFDGLRSATM